MIVKKNFNEELALNLLKKSVRKNLGKKCKDFMFSCWACEVNMALDILEEWVKSLEEEKNE